MKEETQNEVSLRASITASGLSVSVKSRTISAIDRLLGGLVGIPTTYLESIEARIGNRTARESVIQEAAADRLKDAISNDEEIPQAIAELAINTNLVPTVNKGRVVDMAVKELLQSDAGEKGSLNQDEVQEVDPDWLNHFACHAEKASSDKIRTLWARVLAGEIRRGGSFSLSTLRLLSELDKRIATAFENAVKDRLGNKQILTPTIDEMQGARLEELSLVAEFGLIQHVDPLSGLALQISPGTDGKWCIREQNLVLVSELKDNIELQVVPLTRAGREIVSILSPANPLEVLEKVGRAIETDVHSMEIHRITVEIGNDRYRTAHVKTLKVKQGQ